MTCAISHFRFMCTYLEEEETRISHPESETCQIRVVSIARVRGWREDQILRLALTGSNPEYPPGPDPASILGSDSTRTNRRRQ